MYFVATEMRDQCQAIIQVYHMQKQDNRLVKSLDRNILFIFDFDDDSQIITMNSEVK